MQGAGTKDQLPTQFKYCEAKHDEDALVHCCIVVDGLTPGQVSAQILHAAGESAKFQVPDHTIALALRCRDQKHLLQLATKMVKLGIEHKVIRECDGSALAIGVVPTKNRKLLRKVTGSLPLIK